MDRAIAGRIQAWETHPLTGGYRGLGELADASFSGAVTTGTAWLFLLNGRIIGVADGTLETFESADLTAYEAPDPTLPLLFAMQEQGGEAQAKYYTDDNPLPEVHETLSEASFTGYLELSDNVLSGDYYVVYYGGKSMSAAFVGNAEKLVTGDEAFSQAADEVGIYEVIDVELDVRDVPAPADGTDGAAAAAVTDESGASADDVGDEPAPLDGVEAHEPVGEPAEDAAPAEDEGDEAVEEPPAAAEPDDVEPAASAEAGGEPAEQAPPSGEPAEASQPSGESAGSAPPAGEPDAGQPPAGEGQDPEDPFSQEAAWREARTIPALDPDETDATPAAEDGGQQQAPSAPAQEPAEEPAGQPVDEPTGAAAEPAATDDAPEPAADENRLEELESAIERQSETIAELESRLGSTSAEADALREEREELEARLASARQGDAVDAPASPTRSLDERAALDQTDLFVRYDSKAGGTLEKAHDGILDREEVVENLRIDHHTRFEEAEVTVEGRDFRSFLFDTLEYRFVDWLVTRFLFEIQDTGSQRGLRDLFDAIPRIDRVEFQGSVTWRDQEEGVTHEEGFDVVCRDRMGRALIVANLNDVRDPATGDMMTALIEGASTIAQGVETLGGAFMVTSSFFQPDALETTSDATGGGLLSREKRWSYVKLARRHGYHLCLVEARGDDFHVAVPEL